MVASCVYELSDTGELNIKPSSNKISFGTGDNIASIDGGEIKFENKATGDTTRISKSGVRKAMKNKSDTLTPASDTLDIDTSENNYTFNVSASNKHLKSIRFTNIAEGNSGILALYYTVAFEKEITFTTDDAVGGTVKSKDGNMVLTNITSVYDVVNYFCYSDTVVLIEVQSYATIDGAEITTEDLSVVSTRVSTNATSIASVQSTVADIPATYSTKAELSGFISSPAFPHDATTDQLLRFATVDGTTIGLKTMLDEKAAGSDVTALQDDVTALQTNVTDLMMSPGGGGGSANVAELGATIEFGSFSGGVIDVHVNLDTLKFDTSANTKNMIALAFDCEGITLDAVTTNPFVTELGFSQVSDRRVAIMSLSSTPAAFSNFGDKQTIKISYTELYGPEPFTLDGHYPLYYTSGSAGSGSKAVSKTWSNGDTSTYYVDTGDIKYTEGDYQESVHHFVSSVEILDSNNVSYSTNDHTRFYVSYYGGKFALNGVSQKEINVFENCEYTFITEVHGSHPLMFTEHVLGGPEASAYTKYMTMAHHEKSTHPGTTGVTFVTNPEHYYTKIKFKPQADTPDVLYYQCEKHSGMGGKMNVVKQYASSDVVTYYVNAHISDVELGSLSNDTDTLEKILFSVSDDPYSIFANSIYTAPKDGMYMIIADMCTKNIGSYETKVRLKINGAYSGPPVINMTANTCSSKTFVKHLSKGDALQFDYRGELYNHSSISITHLSSQVP